MELKWKLHQYTLRYSQHTDSPVAIMGVKRGTLVKAVAVRVAEAFTNISALEVGDGGDPDGFGAITYGSTQLENLSGAYLATQVGAAAANGKLYTEDDTIDVTFTTSDTPGAGLATIYVVYAEIE